MEERSALQEWERPRLTRGTLFVLGAMNLVDCVNACLLTPYVDQMVSDFLGRPTNDGSVVQTVGLLIGLYSLCEVIFSPFWGFLADRLGRKPVLLIGLAGSAIAPVIFGLAENLPMVFMARGLDGFFCGNLGVTKAYLGEIVDSTNEARGFSFLAVCFSLGLFIGPALGGQLVYPAEWLPQVFGGTTFECHPFLLPNLTYACFAAFAWCLGLRYLKETLPPNQRCWSRCELPQSSGLLQNGGSDSRHTLAGQDRSQTSRQTLVICGLLLAYSAITGYTAAWSQNFAVIVSLPRSIAGFALDPRQIGMLQNAAGVGLLSTQLLLYPRATKRLGFFSCFIGGAVLNLVVTVLFPVYGLLANQDAFGAWRYVPLACMQFLGQAGFGFVFPTMFVWINRSLEGKDKGSWNGWINSSGALFRSVFPPVMDALLSFGLRSGLPGGRYFSIFANALAFLVALAVARIAVRALEIISSARKLASSLQGQGDMTDAAAGA